MALVAAGLFMASYGQAESGPLGALKVCSSVTPEHCAQTIHWPSQARRHDLFRIDEPVLMRWALAVDAVPGSEPPMDRLEWLRGHVHERRYTREALLAALWPDGQEWPAAERQKLLDHLELEQAGREEQVSLVDSRNQTQVEALTALVNALPAGPGERPLIAINAAAQADPYGSLARVRQALEQAGAEVVWLPLDAALRRARAEQNCLGLPRYQALELQRWRRDQVHPEAFRTQLAFCLGAAEGLAMLNQASAVFLIGDDAELLARGWTGSAGLPTTELIVLSERYGNGELRLIGPQADLLRQLIEQGSPVP